MTTADSLQLAAYGPDEDEIRAVEDAANRLRLKACGLAELDTRSRRGYNGLTHLEAGTVNVMKITYDQEVDVLRVVFSGAKIQESDEDKPGVVLDYDKDGNVVGIEILNASKRVENPRSVEYAVAG